MTRLGLLILLGGLVLMPLIAKGSDAVYGDLSVGISGDFLKTVPPLVAQVPAITGTRYDWNEWSGHTVTDWSVPTLVARGCRGEYVPLTFLALHGGGRTNFMVTAEPFRNDEFTFPDVQRTQGFAQPSTDIRWVKWWWQSGAKHYDNKHPCWVPELLLHDFDMVQSSRDVPNVILLRDGDLPQDAATLQPMTIPPGPFGYQQQVWMTIYIPLEAPAGLYEGSVTLTNDQTPDLTVPIRLYVWPFDLVRPRVDYSIYYRARVAFGKEHTYSRAIEEATAPERFISSELRTMVQMKADLANMVRHGVTNPAMYVPPNKLTMLPILHARRSVGCDNTRIFNMGGGVGQQLESDLSNLRGLMTWAASTSKAYMLFLRRYGVKELGRYGVDEGSLEQIASQVPLWKSAQQDGAFIYTAINTTGFEDIIEDSLGVAVIGCGQGYPTPETITKLHEVGTEVYVYGNPQCGDEDPVIYRLSQGLKMMASGVDGSMDYAWQHVFVHPSLDAYGAPAWDDFSHGGHGTFRSHMMTYPGVDTPVDTLQWEGFAAGITDAAYLTTLEAEIDAQPEGCALAGEAQVFIDRIYSEPNTVGLDEMRLTCAQWIMRLQEAGS